MSVTPPTGPNPFEGLPPPPLSSEFIGMTPHSTEFGIEMGEPLAPAGPSAIRLAFGGLRDRLTQGRIDRFEDRADTTAGDAEVHKNAAIGTIEKQTGQKITDPPTPEKPDAGTVKPVDVLQGFGAMHRTTMAEITGLKQAEADRKRQERDAKPAARTRIQEGAASRAGLRGDAIRSKERLINKYVDLHGDFLKDRKEMKQELKSGRYTRRQRGNIKKDGRIVRRAMRSIGESRSLHGETVKPKLLRPRIQDRLVRQAKGEDLPGRLLSRKEARERNKASKLRTRLTNRQQRRGARPSPTHTPASDYGLFDDAADFAERLPIPRRPAPGEASPISPAESPLERAPSRPARATRAPVPRTPAPAPAPSRRRSAPRTPRPPAAPRPPIDTSGLF